MTIEEYLSQIEEQKEIATQARYNIDQLNRNLFQEHCPVKKGWIIEDGGTRIRVEWANPRIADFAEYGVLTWEAWGKALNKDNSVSRRNGGLRSIRISNLESPKSTVKIISKGKES